MRFRIDGIPVPKARPVVTRDGHAFTPLKSRKWEEYVSNIAECAMINRGEEQFTEAVTLMMVFWMPIPNSWSAKKKKLAMNDTILPETKPDLDNLVKGVMDGMTKAGVWDDDKRVTDIIARKRYADKPHVDVLVYKAEKEW